MAAAYESIAQIASTPNCLPQSARCKPSKATLRIASFRCVRGNARQIGCSHDGKLSIEEMTGGTFSITNGGVFGSMLSTPILNPPQSAILGMHNIVERPVVKNGEVVVRPIMFLALSYDHRIVDGRESVSFLVRVKEMLEDPGRLILGI